MLTALNLTLSFTHHVYRPSPCGHGALCCHVLLYAKTMHLLLLPSENKRKSQKNEKERKEVVTKVDVVMLFILPDM